MSEKQLTKILKISALAYTAFQSYKLLKAHRKRHRRPQAKSEMHNDEVSRDDDPPEKMICFDNHIEKILKNERLQDAYSKESIGMTMQSLEKLFDLLLQKLKRFCKKEHLRPEERLVLTLMYLRNGRNIGDLAKQFNIGYFSAASVIQETCANFLEILLEMYMQLPDYSRLQSIEKEFREKIQLENCIGVISDKDLDGLRPKYYTKMGEKLLNTSTVVFAACDCDFNFMFADVGLMVDEGVRTSNSTNSSKRMFSRAGTVDAFVEQLDLFYAGEKPLAPEGTSRKTSYYFAGKTIFPIDINTADPSKSENKDNIKMAVDARLTNAQDYFNTAFNKLIHHWPVLKVKAYQAPNTLCDTVLSTIVLHNFLLKNHDEFYEATVGSENYTEYGCEFELKDEPNDYEDIENPWNCLDEGSNDGDDDDDDDIIDEILENIA